MRPPRRRTQDKARDPDMHQTRKGSQWYFGMKAHIGVDHQTQLIHSVAVTAANVHDSQLLGDLLHGGETRVWGDSTYAGQKKQLHEHTPKAKDLTQKIGSRYPHLSAAKQSVNRYKSKTRSRVEYVFGAMKRKFGFTKVRYWGLDKNAQYVFSKCAQVNLVLAKRKLLAV